MCHLIALQLPFNTGYHYRADSVMQPPLWLLDAGTVGDRVSMGCLSEQEWQSRPVVSLSWLGLNDELAQAGVQLKAVLVGAPDIFSSVYCGLQAWL